MKSSVFKFIIDLYPPYLGTGIRVQRVSEDYRGVDVQMGLHWYNRNYVGTHFGGNLSVMTDPFYMLMKILGKNYLIWDRSNSIEFIKPCKGLVKASFRISQPLIDEIVSATATGNKYLPTLWVEIVDDSWATIARVSKTLYIRRKEALRGQRLVASAGEQL